MPTISQTTAAGQLARMIQMHLEIAGELPTIDKVRGLTTDAEAMTGQSITLADLVRATRDAVKNHADAQAGNALDSMREALSIYERTDINDKTQSARQMGRMQSALDTLQKMDALRL